MKKLVFFSIVVLIIACKNNREEVIEQKYPNGEKKIVLIYEGEGEHRHPVEQKSYYINGSLEVTGKFNNNNQREGIWIYYYENGNKWSECEYSSGVRNGKSVTYYENGNKRYEGKYSNDKQIGRWIFYKKNGTKETEKEF